MRFGWLLLALIATLKTNAGLPEMLLLFARQAAFARGSGHGLRRLGLLAAGGGMVTAEVSGQGVVKRVKLDPSVVNPNDTEMLEDLIMAATIRNKISVCFGFPLFVYVAGNTKILMAIFTLIIQPDFYVNRITFFVMRQNLMANIICLFYVI